MDNTRPLRRKEASAYLHEKHGISRAPATLAKLACVGGGPVFRRFNNTPLYLPSDLDAWVNSNLSSPLSHTSTLSL